MRTIQGINETKYYHKYYLLVVDDLNGQIFDSLTAAIAHRSTTIGLCPEKDVQIYEVNAHNAKDVKKHFEDGSFAKHNYSHLNFGTVEKCNVSSIWRIPL